MNVGYFDTTRREYVITSPFLPARWINYVGTLDFGGFVDHTGGGIICKKDPALNRITKYVMQLPPSAMNGETCYIRIKTDKGYHIFSPFYVPVLKPLDSYECRVGLFYSQFKSECAGLRVEVTVFVPEKHPRVLRKIKVTNISDKPLNVDVIPVVEYSHFDALKDLTNADWVPQTMQSRLAVNPDGGRMVTQFAYMKKEFGRNFFTSNVPFSSFETSRKLFMGDSGYGSWQHPLSLMEDELSNTEVNRGDNICALMHHLGRLSPGEEREIITQLGQMDELKDEWEKIAWYCDPAHVEEAFEEHRTFWEKYLAALFIDTPDEAMNTMLNIYHPRQCFITFNWSRDLSLYQLGFGGRGLGFRDSAQDSLGILASAPERARALIEKLFQVQCRDGHAMHQFYASTMEANAGDSRAHPDRPSYYSDDHLWIILAVTGYLKETGDMAFLEKELNFYDKDLEKKPLESGSVLDHMERAIRYTREHTGAHGLPLLGFADWNDTVNLEAGAESFFTACLYGRALLEMIELSRYLRQKNAEKEYRNLYEEMKQRVNEHCWDGEWFIRYFDKHGT
ncbi:MAG TPA: glycosyl transferase, partial [Spirochaetia bacterium]|nr:glycosyl transferase [Spirochaetia bacterium]